MKFPATAVTKTQRTCIRGALAAGFDPDTILPAPGDVQIVYRARKTNTHIFTCINRVSLLSPIPTTQCIRHTFQLLRRSDRLERCANLTGHFEEIRAIRPVYGC